MIYRTIMALSMLALSAQGQAAPLEDFGETNFSQLQSRFKAITDGTGATVRITQLGDSHTAGDYLSDTLRKRMQSRFGNAGIGWIAPINIPGQRNARVQAKNSGFTLQNSRKTTAAFPIGGFIAHAQGAGSQIRVSVRQQDSSRPWKVRFWLRTPQGGTATLIASDSLGAHEITTREQGTQWQAQEQVLYTPFTLSSGNRPTAELGGMELMTMYPGVIVDSIGSNGAQLTIWNRWNRDWPHQLTAMNSDLVILAYGINEAYDDNLDLKSYQDNLQASINKVRSALPKASILLIGTQDSARTRGRTSNECTPGRPVQLSAVKQVQQQVAQSNHLLFWDWEQAMGGRCSMPRWKQQQLARPDLVHFTAAGYEKLGNDLFDSLMQKLGL
jgi:lysophospholipase L1-like esterase